MIFQLAPGGGGDAISNDSITYYYAMGDKNRLNMEVDLQSLFGLHVTWCEKPFFIGWNPATPPLPPHLDSYYEGAIGQQR